jgi:hypothetical protein
MDAIRCRQASFRGLAHHRLAQVTKGEARRDLVGRENLQGFAEADRQKAETSEGVDLPGRRNPGVLSG